MNSLYKNFKYKIGDKVWVCHDNRPVQCEIINKVPSFFGRSYIVALSDETNEHIQEYEHSVCSTKEELCLRQIEADEADIKKLEEKLVGIKARKELWEAFKEEEK